MLTALERAICFCWYNMTKMAWSVTHGFIHMLRVPKERTSAPSRSRYPATTWSSEQHLSPMVRFMFGCWFFLFFFYELNLMKALVPASNYGLSLQAGAGWMLWSWLSAAPVSTSWQPKQGEKQILARLQSPHIYSTCSSLPHSVIQSCYSKQYTHTAAHSDIILIYLTFISYCWAICVSCDHITITSFCSCPFTHKTAGSFTRHIVAVLCVQYSEIPDGRSKI